MSEFLDYKTFWEKINDRPYSYVRLKNRSDKIIVPYPSKSATKEARVEQINKFLQSDNTPDGIYIIEIKTSSNQPADKFQIKKDTKGNLSEEKPIEFKEEVVRQQIEQDVMTNSEIVDLRVNYEKLKFQLEQKDKEIIELNQQLDELEEALEEQLENETLSENTGNQFAWLKDILPPLADSYFELQRENNEIKRAQIGLQMKSHQAPAPQPQNVPTKEEIENIPPTKEGILAFKEKSTAEVWEQFYNTNKHIIDQIMNHNE